MYISMKEWEEPEDCERINILRRRENVRKVAVLGFQNGHSFSITYIWTVVMSA